MHDDPRDPAIPSSEGPAHPQQSGPKQPGPTQAGVAPSAVGPAALTPAENLFDYFASAVRARQPHVAAALCEDTALYLAQLLTEHARTDRQAPAADTLAELHFAAAHAPPGRRARTYRELGDRALLALALFREHVESTVVGPRYYAAMGVAGYRAADRTLKLAFADVFGPVFEELAAGFHAMVDLVARIRHDAEAELRLVHAPAAGTAPRGGAAALVMPVVARSLRSGEH
jgi:hypothetical protein